MSEHRSFKYFKEETLVASAEQYGWTLINDDNRKTIFMNMIQRMDMTYSYKPVLIMAMLAFSDSKGRVKLSDIVLYFRRFYSDRRRQGLMIERSNSIYCREDITDKQIERHILMKPFRRFEEMHMMRHTKTLGIIEMDNSVWKRLTEEEKTEIKGICEEKLGLYYRRIEEQP